MTADAPPGLRRGLPAATLTALRSAAGQASIFLVACLLTTAAGAQTPDVPDDEVDFEGFTSLSLGSGARAFGMGGAFLARADDATAASWNPAGLSYLRRPEFSIVGARNSFERGNFGAPATDRLTGYTPDFLAVTYPLQSGSVQVSYQRIFSFRGTREIERVGRTFTTEGEGGYDVLAFGSGWRVGRTLRVGGTVNGWFNGYSQRRLRISTNAGTTEQDIDYDLDSGINFNLGAIWTPVENLNFGAVGKTPFTAILNLRRFRSDTFLDPPAVTENRAERSDVLIDFPGAVGFGLSWRPASPLTFSADYTRTFWSRGRIRNFFVLNATPPPDGRPPDPVDYRELPYPTINDPDQTDTEQIRLGFEAVAIAGRLRFPIRAGLFWDRQYFRADSPTGVPPRFEGFTLGTGVSAGPLLVDFAFVRESGRFLPVNEPVLVRTRFSRVFASIIYRHGQ